MVARTALVLGAMAQLGCAFPDYGLAAMDSSTGTDAAHESSTTDADPPEIATDACTPGSPCAPCMTGKTTCAGGDAGACSVVDDRTSVVDSEYASTMGNTRLLDRRGQLAIGYPMHRKGTPSSLRLTFGRVPYSCGITTALPHPDPACSDCVFTGTYYTCSVPKPAAGRFIVRVMHGVPTDASATELARVELDAATLPMAMGMPAPTTVPFAIMSTLPISASIYAELSTDSTAWSFQLSGDRAKSFAPPADLMTWSRPALPMPGSWTADPMNPNRPVTAYAFEVRGCF